MNAHPIVKLKEKKDMPVRAGHPWVFSNAIQKADKADKGSVVLVESAAGDALGLGTWNPDNTISARMLTRDPKEAIDRGFFVRRLKKLDDQKRKHLPADTDGYRVAHADADFLPGLIVDRFADAVVLQVNTIGMEKLKELAISAIDEVLRPQVIVERSDVESRKKEGLGEGAVEVHKGEMTGPRRFRESGFVFLADVLEGQKTGFFLDQRDARRKVMELSGGRRVLDLFGYSGAFGLYAAKGGAKSVKIVDVSARAKVVAGEMFGLNGMELKDGTGLEYAEYDIFDFMNRARDKKERYDLIICDPPAFTRSAANVDEALKTYTHLNKQCFELLADSGILMSSSCSGMVTAEDFRNVLKLAAGRAGKDASILAFFSQPFDHTQKLSFPEGKYLKTFFTESI